MATKPVTESLKKAVREAPFASYDEAEVNALVVLLSERPAKVADALDSEAGVHASCGNYIKADVLSRLATRVWKLVG